MAVVEHSRVETGEIQRYTRCRVMNYRMTAGKPLRPTFHVRCLYGVRDIDNDRLASSCDRCRAGFMGL